MINLLPQVPKNITTIAKDTGACYIQGERLSTYGIPKDLLDVLSN